MRERACSTPAATSARARALPRAAAVAGVFGPAASLLAVRSAPAGRSLRMRPRPLSLTAEARVAATATESTGLALALPLLPIADPVAVDLAAPATPAGARLPDRELRFLAFRDVAFG